jgi:hypothetical protein
VSEEPPKITELAERLFSGEDVTLTPDECRVVLGELERSTPAQIHLDVDVLQLTNQSALVVRMPDVMQLEAQALGKAIRRHVEQRAGLDLPVIVVGDLVVAVHAPEVLDAETFEATLASLNDMEANALRGHDEALRAVAAARQAAADAGRAVEKRVSDLHGRLTNHLNDLELELTKVNDVLFEQDMEQLVDEVELHVERVRSTINLLPHDR